MPQINGIMVYLLPVNLDNQYFRQGEQDPKMRFKMSRKMAIAEQIPIPV